MNRRLSLRIALVCLLLTMLAATVRIAWAGRSPHEIFHGTLQIVPLFNGTGNTALDSVPTSLLVKELGSAANFAVHGATPSHENRAGENVSGKDANGTLTGSILAAKGGYAIHLQVTDTATHTRLAEADDLAPSVEQVPAAVTRASAAIRDELGEVRSR